MEDKNSFFLEGVPENSQFEVPDENKKGQKRGSGKEQIKLNITADMFKKMLPEDLLKELEDEASAQGMSLDQAFNDAMKLMGGGIPGLFNQLMGMNPEDIADEADDFANGIDESEEDLTLPFAKVKYLDPSSFGSIPCRVNPNIYGDFFEKYGDDPSAYFENSSSNIHFSEVTSDIATTEIVNAKLIAYDDTVLIFFVTPKDESKYGFFVSVYQELNGEFKMFIPEFWNTFLATEQGKARLVDREKDRRFFDEHEDGSLVFTGYNEGSVAFSTKFTLAPVHKTIISPVEFGTIKNLMPVIKSDSNLLKVATIKINGSKKAEELRADGDFNPEQENFDLYFNFGQQISKDSLFEISSILFKTNLNDCFLMRNTELHFVPGKYLYVNIDLGSF